MTMRMRYRGVEAEAFEWLHVDFETLSDLAAKAGWRAERVVETAGGDYLCRLAREE
jgi:hypothetical protein